jgi:hypothetical protein
MAADLEENIKPIASQLPRLVPPRLSVSSALRSWTKPVRRLLQRGDAVGEDDTEDRSGSVMERFCRGMLAVESERARQMGALKVRHEYIEGFGESFVLTECSSYPRRKSWERPNSPITFAARKHFLSCRKTCSGRVPTSPGPRRRPFARLKCLQLISIIYSTTSTAKICGFAATQIELYGSSKRRV